MGPAMQVLVSVKNGLQGKTTAQTDPGEAPSDANAAAAGATSTPATAVAMSCRSRKASLYLTRRKRDFGVQQAIALSTMTDERCRDPKHDERAGVTSSRQLREELNFVTGLQPTST